MILTRELIEAGMTGHGSGYSKSQLKILGVDWPPQRGWKKGLIGKEISTEDYDKYISLSVKIKKVRAYLTPKTKHARKKDRKKLRKARRKKLRKARKLNKAIHDSFLKSYEWRKLRYEAFLKCGKKCQCCGASPADGIMLHVDHIKPRKKHPELALDLDNLQVLCSACNHGKGNWDETDHRGI